MDFERRSQNVPLVVEVIVGRPDQHQQEGDDYPERHGLNPAPGRRRQKIDDYAQPHVLAAAQGDNRSKHREPERQPRRQLVRPLQRRVEGVAGDHAGEQGEHLDHKNDRRRNFRDQFEGKIEQATRWGLGDHVGGWKVHGTKSPGQIGWGAGCGPCPRGLRQHANILFDLIDLAEIKPRAKAGGGGCRGKCASGGQLGCGFEDPADQECKNEIAAAIAVGAKDPIKPDPAGGAESGGDVAVRQGADDGEGFAPGRDDSAASEHAAQTFDVGGGPVREVAEVRLRTFRPSR